MAIKITENGVVRYENEPNVDRLLFPNTPDCGSCTEQIDELSEQIGELKENLSESVSDLKSAFDDIETAFVIGGEPLTLSSFTRGKFITANGTEDTLSNVEYASAIIDESTVGKQLLISGSAWYSNVKPYVFVASNGTKQVADVPNPGSTPTQHTDIPFTPNTTGTLYLNRYNNTTNNVQVAKAIYKVLASIKGDYLPEDVGDYVYDATNYTGINFETVSNKMLKGTTGVITDESKPNFRVTEYIDIHAYSKLMITACNFYSYGLYSFYDSNKTYIPNSGKDAASGSTVTKIYNEIVNVPDGAKYIVIGFLYNHMTTPYLFGAIDRSILPSKGWAGLKWACIGDSLTAYNDATAFHYFDYIRADSGIDVINMGVGGTGYMRGADNSNAFYQRVLSIANDCDVCTVFGSGNDLSLYESIGDYTDTGTATICGCVNTFLDNYFSICPTAPIGIIAPTPWISCPTTMVANNHMDDYVEKLQKIANYRGVPFLDLYHGSNLRPENETNRNACFYNESSLDGNGDGVHPNELGHRIIAPKIYEFLKTLLLD